MKDDDAEAKIKTQIERILHVMYHMVYLRLASVDKIRCDHVICWDRARASSQLDPASRRAFIRQTQLYDEESESLAPQKAFFAHLFIW